MGLARPILKKFKNLKNVGRVQPWYPSVCALSYITNDLMASGDQHDLVSKRLPRKNISFIIICCVYNISHVSDWQLNAYPVHKVYCSYYTCPTVLAMRQMYMRNT